MSQFATVEQLAAVEISRMTMVESKEQCRNARMLSLPREESHKLGGSGAGRGEVGRAGPAIAQRRQFSESRAHTKRQVGAREATCGRLVGRDTAGVSSAQTASGIALRGLCLASPDASIGDRGMASSCPMDSASGILKSEGSDGEDGSG